MLGKRLSVRLGSERVQQARRPLDVREEEGDRPGRESRAHRRSIGLENLRGGARCGDAPNRRATGGRRRPGRRIGSVLLGIAWASQLDSSDDLSPVFGSSTATHRLSARRTLDHSGLRRVTRSLLYQQVRDTWTNTDGSRGWGSTSAASMSTTQSAGDQTLSAEARRVRLGAMRTAAILRRGPAASDEVVGAAAHDENENQQRQKPGPPAVSCDQHVDLRRGVRPITERPVLGVSTETRERGRGGGGPGFSRELAKQERHRPHRQVPWHARSIVDNCRLDRCPGGASTLTVAALVSDEGNGTLSVRVADGT